MTLPQETYPLEMKSDWCESSEFTEETLAVLVLLKTCCWNDYYDIVLALTLSPSSSSVITSRGIFTALTLPNCLLWSLLLNCLQPCPCGQQVPISPCDSTSQNILQILLQAGSMHRDFCSDSSRVPYYPFPFIPYLNIHFCYNLQKHPALGESKEHLIQKFKVLNE